MDGTELSDLSISPLTALSPLDGRYRNKTDELAFYMSEYGLINARIEIEVKHLIALSETGVIRKFSADEKTFLLSLYDIGTGEIERVKEIEKETRHDVKAVEMFIREKVAGSEVADVTEFIHFGLTSEDINNLAYRLILQRGTENVCLPLIEEIIEKLLKFAEENKSLPMLARTHGQAAVPTTLGKELAVFASRLFKEKNKLSDQKLTGKFSGAVGNFNALEAAYPKTDWIKYSEDFVSSLGFEPNLVTTQINTPEDIIEHLQIYQRIHGIILDFDLDMWRYISDEWFLQVKVKGEVGSSTMPQKVNPIDFENSEGNLTIANGMIDTLTRKLATSRLQRDLSDSTTIRNLGTVLGYSVLGYKSLSSGMGRVSVNPVKIGKALNKNWTILGEGVQTILRSEGVEDPYSLIAGMTKGEVIDEIAWEKWVGSLPVSIDARKRIQKLTPDNYLGLAEKICERVIKQIREV